MQNGVDVYPPVFMSIQRLLMVGVLVIVVIGGRLLVIAYMRRLALRRQQKAVTRAQTKDTHAVEKALAQLEAVRAAYGRGELAASAAAEQASAIARETYDYMMNHRTRYQARYEVASRRLEQLATLLQATYPVQFADPMHQIAPDALEHVFAKAREVIESCR